MERIEAHRVFFANLITAKVGIPPGGELATAFASTPRERFVGPPPWKILTPIGYIETPSDDPTFLYQDVVVSLGAEGPLNNGEPTLHARCLSTLAIRKGATVIHVGAGTGYYTNLIAKLVGESGTVEAFEIDPNLARRAVNNLA
jgi:protein-L-isoaspartate(D-aspartate) O-methyltransferase